MFAKISLHCVAIVGLIAFSSSYMGAESSVELSPKASSIVAEMPHMSTDVWGIFDPATGVIFAGNNIEVAQPIASVSKLFTATAVMQSPHKDDVFAVTEADVLTEGRSGKLVTGIQTTPYQLLFPLLIESSNDAGTAIKRKLATEFDTTVQDLISSLDLKNTHVGEPTGLSAANTSSVADLAKFYAYIKEKYPHILDITELYTYVDDRTGYSNSNPARKLENFTGGKQGYTDEAGSTFVGSFYLAGSSHEVGIVILGSTQLFADIQSLLHTVDARKSSSDILKP